eukprot:CAMPEP_0197024744 /NCGR_PEP_ID=MMETSP1384-20130603/5245_1 /TAXON_ID=29189 /ORGANISM="Ammonia sp." /LENGTH=362 /DNA_ID=CAMNT_0042453183 /DNA_START=116 /DNA_END=1204 /DNA_ORIENTATION=+
MEDEAELWAEIEKEALNKNNDSASFENASSANANATQTAPEAILDTAGSGELTTFQENIITTGSDVSVLLMIILVILFIIQFVRKSYNYFTLQSKIRQVANPLDAAKPIAAENLTPINPRYDHTAYAVYNTEFEDRSTYLQKESQGAPPSVLKEILLKRAIKCIEKARVLQRDGVGIRKNWNMDLLPRDVWDDYNSAQRNLQAEIECVVQENNRFQFNWGQPHGVNVFSKARDEYDRKMSIMNNVLHQRMQQQRQRQQQMMATQRNGNAQEEENKNAASAPSAKAFGNGFTPGFFNQNENQNKKAADTKKLSRKEKKELSKQKKQMRNDPNLQSNIENPANPGNPQQSQVRRRKGKHRFPTK